MPTTSPFRVWTTLPRRLLVAGSVIVGTVHLSAPLSFGEHQAEWDAPIGGGISVPGKSVPVGWCRLPLAGVAVRGTFSAQHPISIRLFVGADPIDGDPASPSVSPGRYDVIVKTRVTIDWQRIDVVSVGPQVEVTT